VTSSCQPEAPWVDAAIDQAGAEMERQPGRSAAVAQFGRVGCIGARQSFGLRRQASWLKVWRGGAGVISTRRNEHTSGTEGRLTRNASGQVWSRRLTISTVSETALQAHDQPF
jgi:hypothetical protein